jgi:hypothetical protein
MTIGERIAERLANVPFEEQLRERLVPEARKTLGCSKAEIYRRVSHSTLACIKVEGARRRGHGQAGRVSFLLEHLVRWQVEHEVPAGVKTKPKRGRPS